MMHLFNPWSKVYAYGPTLFRLANLLFGLLLTIYLQIHLAFALPTSTHHISYQHDLHEANHSSKFSKFLSFHTIEHMRFQD